MFIWSLKTSKREIIFLIIGLIMFAAALIYVFCPRKESEASALLEQGYTVNASNETERRMFISQFGWETEEDPVQVREIVIPAEFSDVYIKYNEIQTAQGFDLTKHKGEKVKHWTYRVTNYPDTTDVIYANLLIQDGKVIGGDICSTALDGFMHGFSPEQNADVISEVIAKVYADEAEADRVLFGAIPENSEIKAEEDY